jgi:hypothetical protein
MHEDRLKLSDAIALAVERARTLMDQAPEFTGRLDIDLYDRNGALKDTRRVENMVVTTGKNWIMSRMTATPSTMDNMAIGTGSTAAAVGDTALGSEIARVANSSATTSGNVTTYTCVFGAGVGTGSITEAGIFNATTAGTMLARATFTAIAKGASDSLSITWTVTGN